jgi:hypothetical protein
MEIDLKSFGVNMSTQLLIRAMLIFDPEKRMKIEDVLEHPSIMHPSDIINSQIYGLKIEEDSSS